MSCEDKVLKALGIYQCSFLSSSLWDCLWETLHDIIWEIYGCAKNNQRIVTNTCPKLDIVYGKTSSPHILPKHIMYILVLMEVAYQMAKFGGNYKLKEHITITIYTIIFFYNIGRSQQNWLPQIKF